MIRVYREHPEFGQFTKVESRTGRLTDITEAEFRGFLPDGFAERDTEPQRVKGNDATIFTGPTSESHTRFPRRVYFQITRRCNLECAYCFLDAGHGRPHVPTPFVLDMAAFLGAHGLVEARLTGGEPTTHPDFFRIVEAFQQAGVFVSVATNGLLDRRVLERLGEQKHLWLICSVDGGREVHNRYRPGTFDRIIANLRHLKARNPSLRVRLTTVLTRQNKDQMRELARICRQVDAESITIIPLRPQVRDRAVLRDMVTAAEFRQVIQDLVAARQEFGIRFTTTLETDFAGHIQKDPVFRKRSSCAAGREGTNLDYDAARRQFVLYGCSYSPASDLHAPQEIRRPFVAGQFAADEPTRFLDVWHDESAWVIFRDLSFKHDDCKRCRYYAEHTCVGSCPIQNVDYSRIRSGGDVLSQLRAQIEHTSEWYCYQKILGVPDVT
ncbi:MAG TPA: radical SAM protein [Thermoguttaceae bacterium]|nr:radical SAM protein [Thermoguttaceae bacterium]